VPKSMASVPVWQPAQAVQYLPLVAARVAPSFLHKGS